jgi:hypothetical protein
MDNIFEKVEVMKLKEYYRMEKEKEKVFFFR